jgi:hypothetical protein
VTRLHTMSADWTGEELDGQHMAEIGYILDQCQRGYGLSVCRIEEVEQMYLSIILVWMNSILYFLLLYLLNMHIEYHIDKYIIGH